MSQFDPVKKAPPPQAQAQGGNLGQQYAYAVPMGQGSANPGSGGGAAPGSNTGFNHAYNFGGGSAPAAGGGANYNIDLGKQNIDLGSGQSNYQQYPEAEVNAADPNAPPVEGTPLYPPAEVAANPNLKRFVLSGYQDVWASILFAFFFLFTIIFGIVNMASYKLTTYDNPAAGKTPAEDLSRRFSAAALVGIFVGGLVVALVVAILGIVLAKLFPSQLIYIGNLAIVLMYIASAILFGISRAVAGVIVMLVLAALQILWLFLVRKRIPFAAALLRTSCRILGANKAIFLTNILVSLAFFVFCIFWGAAMLRPVDRLSAKKGNAGDSVLIAILVFAFLWAAQVVTNLMHVTTSGVVATWYFAGAGNMPKYPTAASFKRAITTSFGSICFGSLLVALIQFVRFLLESSRNGNDNNFFRCVADCLLGCLERAVEYFNTYAFVHVAIYGCGYIEAAKRTFALCKQCFFEAYFNDCLVQPTLDMLALVAAIVIGCVFGLIAKSWPVFAWVFAMSWIVHKLMFSAITSSVTALFVCFAEKPEALRNSDPELYATIHAADGGAVHGGNAPPPNV